MLINHRNNTRWVIMPSISSLSSSFEHNIARNVDIENEVENNLEDDINTESGIKLHPIVEQYIQKNNKPSICVQQNHINIQKTKDIKCLLNNKLTALQSVNTIYNKILLLHDIYVLILEVDNLLKSTYMYSFDFDTLYESLKSYYNANVNLNIFSKMLMVIIRYITKNTNICNIFEIGMDNLTNNNNDDILIELSNSQYLPENIYCKLYQLQIPEIYLGLSTNINNLSKNMVQNIYNLCLQEINIYYNRNIHKFTMNYYDNIYVEICINILTYTQYKIILHHIIDKYISLYRYKKIDNNIREYMIAILCGLSTNSHITEYMFAQIFIHKCYFYNIPYFQPDLLSLYNNILHNLYDNVSDKLQNRVLNTLRHKLIQRYIYCIQHKKLNEALNIFKTIYINYINIQVREELLATFLFTKLHIKDKEYLIQLLLSIIPKYKLLTLQDIILPNVDSNTLLNQICTQLSLYPQLAQELLI